MATRWRSLARDYDKLADTLESSGVMPPTRVPMQQQPVQQQQSKRGDEDKTKPDH